MINKIPIVVKCLSTHSHNLIQQIPPQRRQTRTFMAFQLRPVADRSCINSAQASHAKQVASWLYPSTRLRITLDPLGLQASANHRQVSICSQTSNLVKRVGNLNCSDKSMNRSQTPDGTSINSPLHKQVTKLSKSWVKLYHNSVIWTILPFSRRLKPPIEVLICAT